MKLSLITIHLLVFIGSVLADTTITELCTPETIIIPLDVEHNHQPNQNQNQPATTNEGKQKPNEDGAASTIVDAEQQLQSSSTPLCDCRWQNSMPWGMIELRITCREKEFENKYFEAETLPVFTSFADFSWNNFDFVPNLIAEDLLELDMSHNRIEAIDDNNFVGLPNLIVLNLGSNKIVMLSNNAFVKLDKLEHLDLSKNQLKMVTANVFSPLVSLKRLIFSGNKHLNETFGQSGINLYLNLGITSSLEILEIEGSSLDSIDLDNGVGLKELRLKSNNFQIPPDVPRGLEILDLSRNPIIKLVPKLIPNLGDLHTLLMNDMPYLVSIEEFALFGLPYLKHLSFQGSWNLSEFHHFAFGTTDTKLETLNLQGTGLRTLNSSFAANLREIKSIDLNGNPWICDCNIKWIIDLGLETNGKCVKPISLRGRKLSNVTLDELKCRRFPDWVYTVFNGCLILFLLIVSAIATWLLVMGIKPLRKGFRHKVGANSPYAQITIEPNRVEDLR